MNRNTHDRVATHLAELAAKDKDAETKEDKPKKRSTANRMGEDELLADYPHVKPGTLSFLADENKQAVKIACQATKEDGSKCGKERTVRTSDLWQVDKCHACTRKARRAKAKERRAKKKAEEATTSTEG
jgi:hypothetical protein